MKRVKLCVLMFALTVAGSAFMVLPAKAQDVDTEEIENQLLMAQTLAVDMEK